MTVIVVQHIRTVWKKAERGGANAVLRSRIPEAAKIPAERLKGPEITLVQQDLNFGRGHLTVPCEKITANPTFLPLTVGCVTVHELESEVAVHFRYDRECGGAPDRGWARKSLRLSQNEWVQIVYNGRHTAGYDMYQWYEKHAINVGLFERISSGLFTRSAPTHRFDAMAILF